MRTPTGEKYFAHTLCSYRAAQRRHLSSFTLPHTGKKLYACIQCSYRSARSEHLSSHMHSHTGEKQVWVSCGWKVNICILCSYRHVNNFQLSMHMHTRTSEKPFICSIRSKQSTMVHGCMAVWIHGKMDSWQFGFMAQWMHGSLDSWHYGWIQFGFMAQWMHSSLESWHYGYVAVWMHGIFENIPPLPAVVQNQNTLCTFTLIYSKSPKLKTSKLSGDWLFFCRCFNLVDSW